jgi:hypothetical protein
MAGDAGEESEFVVFLPDCLLVPFPFGTIGIKIESCLPVLPRDRKLNPPDSAVFIKYSRLVIVQTMLSPDPLLHGADPAAGPEGEKEKT